MLALLFSLGDGVSFPVRNVDEDYDQLLGERQRWMEEGDADNDGELSERWLTLLGGEVYRKASCVYHENRIGERSLYEFLRSNHYSIITVIFPFVLRVNCIMHKNGIVA